MSSGYPACVLNRTTAVRRYELAVKDGDRPLASKTALNCLRAVLAQIQDVPTHQFLACDVCARTACAVLWDSFFLDGFLRDFVFPSQTERSDDWRVLSIFFRGASNQQATT